MKKLLALLLALCLILALFTGCTGTEAPETESGSTETTAAPTESTETEAATAPEPRWAPYDGSDEDYVYYHEEGRDRDWEEDVLYLAETFLTIHPYLTPEESRGNRMDSLYVEGYYTDEFYDPAKREAFLAGINELIPQISTLDDEGLLFALQKIVARLGDAHARVYIPSDAYFPVEFIYITGEDGSLALHAVFLPEEHDDLLLAELVAINDVPTEQVIEAILPWLSYENMNWVHHTVSNGWIAAYLSNFKLLCQAGIADAASPRAEYRFRLEDGTEESITLTMYTNGMLTEPMAYTYYDVSLPYIRWSDCNYWYELQPEHDMVYCRINRFEPDENISLLELGNQILMEVREAGGVEKFVLDLRGNPGGYGSTGYNEIINLLNRMDIEKVYVLIDNGSFSRAVLFATTIRTLVDKAVLVGTPAGQAPNFFGNVTEYTMPKSGEAFCLGSDWCECWPDYEGEALMPDVLIEQTLEDYKNNVDAVLEYVREQ